MDLADIGRALGYGVVSGLGTAKEQRDRSYEQQKIAEAVLRSQLAAQIRREALLTAETRDRTNRDAANARNQAGIDAANERARMNREAMDARTPLSFVDQESGTVLGQAPNARAEMLVPGSARNAVTQMLPATDEEPPGEVTVEPAQPGRKAMVLPSKDVDTYILRKREERKQKAIEEKEASKISNSGKARQRIKAGEAWEDIRSDYPELTAKDVYGYEPSAPTREPRPPAFDQYRDAMAKPPAARTPADTATIAAYERTHKGKDGAEKNPLDEEYKRLRNTRLAESARVAQSVESIEELAAAGKATPKQLAQAIRDLNADADKDLKFSNEAEIEDADREMLKRSAIDKKRRAVALDRLRKAPTISAPAVPGDKAGAEKRLTERLLGGK